ncbi:MAG: MGMT family protein [Patescibacteria group bacterium]
MTILEKKILSLVNKIPKGKVTTYGLLALKIGNSRLARVVGNAVHKNLNIIVVPCHRVVKSDGQIGNYRLGIAKKTELLQNEGIKIKAGKILNFTDVLYNFN